MKKATNSKARLAQRAAEAAKIVEVLKPVFAGFSLKEMEFILVMDAKGFAQNLPNNFSAQEVGELPKKYTFILASACAE